MKTIVRLLLLSAILTTGMSLVKLKKTTVVFFGDSITAAGVNAGSFIALLRGGLERKGRENEFELVGAGVSGNKIYDLAARVEADVIAKMPDIVVVWIGVNDIWHKSSFGTGTDADKFETYYAALIRRLQTKNIKVFLATPAVIGERTDHSNPQDGDLNHYSNIIRRLAVAHKCGLVDLRKAFLKYNLEHNPENKESGILTSDRVHLNERGNGLVAEQLAAALAL